LEKRAGISIYLKNIADPGYFNIFFPPEYCRLKLHFPPLNGTSMSMTNEIIIKKKNI